MRGLIASVVASLLLAAPAGARPGQKKNAKDDPSQIGRRDITKGALDLYSPQREIEMGREMAQQVERLVSLDDDPRLTGYLQDLTDRIVRNSDAKLPLRVEVIESNDVNAFALPGGYFFLDTGLILRTESEAELAGVIAHEVAHVAARHATREMTEEEIWNWMSLPVLLFGGPVSFTIQQSLNVAAPITFMEFSRRDERQADSLGLQYLYKAGYDPEAFVSFFERAKQMEKDPGELIPRAFSSHPLTRNRVKAAERQIQRDLPPKPEYVVDTSRYQQAKAQLQQFLRDQMPLAPAPAKQGPVLHQSGKAMPSGHGGRQ
ncbi:MAG TPA: M48 family metallopeptidase [Candidatus Acidoferrales bacterium]|nr:M48 family metallopeptidase [Candidatus Acidoferrales bacterium]